MRGGRLAAPRPGGVFRIPIYGVPVLLMYFPGGKDATRAAVVREALRRLGPEWRDFDFRDGFPVEDGSARTFLGKSGAVIVMAARGKDGVPAGRIAHECFHVVTSVAEDYGFALDQAHDEPAAYLLGWLVERVSPRLAAAGIRIPPSEP